MKKLFLLISILGIMVNSCGLLAPSAPDPLAVNATVESGIYVTVNTIIPSNGPSKYTSDGYYLDIQDGKLNTYLPFFGTSNNPAAAYGSSNSGIIVEDKPVEIVETERKGLRVWSFSARNDQEIFRFTLDFSDSGKASITVNSNYRSVMRYNCDVTERPAKKD